VRLSTVKMNSLFIFCSKEMGRQQTLATARTLPDPF